MKTNTIPDVVYSVTAPAGETCRVTATVNDASYTLAVAYDGEQTRFQAVAWEADISSPRAIVRPLTELPPHTAPTDDAGVVRELDTPPGTSNAWWNYVVLNPSLFMPGKLQRISIMARGSQSRAYEIWLGVFEQPEHGGDDPSQWTFIGASHEGNVQVNGTMSVWTFKDVALSGRTIALCGMAARDTGWNRDTQVGSSAAPRAADDSVSVLVSNSTLNYVPQMQFVIREKLTIALTEHLADSAAHVTEEEREAWNAKADAEDVGARVLPSEHALLTGLLGGSQEGALPVLFVKGSQGNTLLTVRGNETNVSVTGSQMSFNVPQLSAMSDVPVLYRYDMASGSSEVWLAGAPDAERLAPMGITEAGTHVGAPSLPLYLRGSEVRINGTVLDVAGLGGGNLSEVEAHIDAHINNGSVHVTNWERERWNSISSSNLTTQEKNYLAQLVNHTDPPHSMGVLVTEDDLSRHENDILAHVTAEERTRWNAKRDSVLQQVESAWRLDGGTVVPDPVGSGITIPAADVATTPLYCLPYPFPENSPRVTNVAHAGSCNVSGYVVTLNKMDPVAGDVFYIWAEFVWMPDGDLPPVRYEGCLKVTIV